MKTIIFICVIALALGSNYEEDLYELGVKTYLNQFV